jgi:hypothetical protein
MRLIVKHARYEIVQDLQIAIAKAANILKGMGSKGRLFEMQETNPIHL